MEALRKVLVIGSGAVKIAEAAEFDYSGSQALKALKEEGLEAILANPNIATIQTSYKFADRVYLLPLKYEFIAKIIEVERPDGIMIGFGGQTALSLGVKLSDGGVLDRYGVRVLGTPIEGVRRALSRSLFRETMQAHGIPIPPSIATSSLEETVEAAEAIGYPVMVRVSFNLGGAGSFVAWSRDQLLRKFRAALAQSEIGEVLVEKYLHNWKEVEFEVVRDSWDNVAAVACMENIDPMGVHTGESIVVAPCQTLTDYEYQLTRNLSINVERAIMLVGEGNVQVALNPFNSDEAYVIETNPRMSRSSALASKATGYPLAYIAAKLALGYKLHEITNKVTGKTKASFEPSLDYVVVKMPRWDLDKFNYVEKNIGSEMKSVGEVMAIGRNFLEALQKAIRMLDIGEPGLVGGPTYDDENATKEYVVGRLKDREPYWPIWAAKAFKLGVSVEDVYAHTGIDKYFLLQIRDAVTFYENLKSLRGSSLEELIPSIAEAKRLGFSDEQIAKALSTDADEVRRLREKLGVSPVVKQVDTLAAEWPAQTNYLYVTYDGWEHDVDFRSSKPKIMVLGPGGFRIGVSVEFDWSTVTFSDEARALGYEVVLVNYNPETVSTDWDINEKLYFEEISLERVLDIYSLERPLGVVAFLGGQVANNIAWELEKRGVKLLGTPGFSVHRAENRALFSKLLEELGIRQPPWSEASNLRDALNFAESVGYPVLVRPSYVLSGSSMKIAWSGEELLEYISKAAKISPKYPAVVSKFFEDAGEFEIDAVGDGRSVVGAVIEHVEPAGVHSGDSTMVLPPRRLSWEIIKESCKIAEALNDALNIKGPFNLQMLHKNGFTYVVELNLRASRSMPFTSKTTGYNLMRASAEAALKGKIESLNEGFNLLLPSWFGVKTPQFSWARLRGAYPHLGPEMRSVGEVAALNKYYDRALILSWLSASGNRLPRKGEAILIYNPVEKGSPELREATRRLLEVGHEVITLEEMEIENLKAIGEEEAIKKMVKGEIGLVMTTGYAPEKDYKVRRAAADLAIPLVLNHKLASELAGDIKNYDGINSEDIADMKKYWTMKLIQIKPI
ncbi:MAG: carbamoyl-phosphate synthase (glutamine-hydrolyzing) large subunit [Thermoprotei archaeon]|nr:carbamoyl-phosphate synthase (glutamine-hydrolyzing) large subunit [Thermoprotei archaeon]